MVVRVLQQRSAPLFPPLPGYVLQALCYLFIRAPDGRLRAELVQELGDRRNDRGTLAPQLAPLSPPAREDVVKDP
jgi:hypothetical protein